MKYKINYNLFNKIEGNKNKLIIIIPYRDRKICLDFLIPKLKEYLKFYNTEYKIIISELDKDIEWNKGICINLAYKYILENIQDNFDYFLINDVDIVPKHKELIEYKGYDYIFHPYGYKHCLGGLFFIPKEKFVEVNGFSNLYYKWGWEDTDFLYRCQSKNMEIHRTDDNIFTRGNDNWHEIDCEPKHVIKYLDLNRRIYETRDYPSKLSIDGINTLNYNYKIVSSQNNIHHIINYHDSTNPLVSVIIPTTYKRKKYLPRIINCFNNQTYINKELLIYDTDNDISLEDYIKDITKNQSNIKYYHNPNKISIGEKRNFLINNSKGEWICHFDDDDYYFDKYIQTMISSVGNNDFIKISTYSLYNENDGTFSYYSNDGEQKMKFDYEDDVIYAYGFTYFYKKRWAIKYPFENLNWNEDGKWFHLCKSKGMKVTYIKEEIPLVIHIIHESNSSRSMGNFKLPWNKQYLIDSLKSNEK